METGGVLKIEEFESWHRFGKFSSVTIGVESGRQSGVQSKGIARYSILNGWFLFLKSYPCETYALHPAGLKLVDK